MWQHRRHWCLTVHHWYKSYWTPTRCNNENLLIFQSPQHVSGNFLPLLRGARLCVTTCGIMHQSCCRSVAWNAEALSSSILHTEHTVSASAFQTTDRQQLGCIIPHAVNHILALLRMGKKLPETCWADWKINKTVIVASSWLSTLFISMMHGQANIKSTFTSYFVLV